MGDDAEVYQAKEVENDRLLPVLARSFDREPFVNWFVRPGVGRIQRIVRFFRFHLATAFRWGEAYTTPGYLGVALWIKPGQWRVDA